MPEGDALYRAAQRLQVLVGERLGVEAPNPRAAVKHIAERLDGRRLEAVEAAGKNLFLRFEGGVTLRSHLKMEGRWSVQPLGRQVEGKPWLVLRGATQEAVLWHGPVLELSDRARFRLGPDILAQPPDLDAMLANLRALPKNLRLGEALQVQRAVAGIGNLWMSEALRRRFFGSARRLASMASRSGGCARMSGPRRRRARSLSSSTGPCQRTASCVAPRSTSQGLPSTSRPSGCTLQRPFIFR